MRTPKTRFRARRARGAGVAAKKKRQPKKLDFLVTFSIYSKTVTVHDAAAVN
jgi:hypothetical protein